MMSSLLCRTLSDRDHPELLRSYDDWRMFSQRYEAALALAARRHDAQRRKSGDLPYLTHLVHVARMLEPYEEEAVIAGLLHDVLEDTCRSFGEIEEVSNLIRRSFGAS